MPSLTAKDRAPLCLFSYEDGRRCRTPRRGNHPHFCFYHAQKESQSQAAEKLSDDLAYFFSGDYLSANDLNTALARLIPATIRGEIKPRLARTVAYMLQTLLQSIHISQDEYINAFSTDGWRKAVRNSVKSNKDYLFPPDPQSTQSAPPPAEPPARPAPPTQPNAAPASAPAPTVCHPERSEGPCPNPTQPPTDETHHPPIPAPPVNPTPNPAPGQTRPTPADTQAALNVARSLFPRRPTASPTQPIAAPTSTPASAPAPTPISTPAPTVCHPERSEGPCPNPTQLPTDETHHPPIPAPPANPTPNPAPTGRPTQTRDRYAVHFDHNHRLLVNGKPW